MFFFSVKSAIHKIVRNVNTLMAGARLVSLQTSYIRPSGCLLNLFRNSHLMSTFFRPDMLYTFNSSYLLLLAIITLRPYRERGILLHSQSLYFHTLDPSAAGGECEMLTVHATVFALMLFPHSDNRLSTQSHLLDSSRLTAALLSHKPPWIPTTKTDSTLVLIFLSFSVSDGVSREPPWLGRKGRVEGQEAAQGGGELHVEHHHTEGEIFIHSRQHASDYYATPTFNTPFCGFVLFE